MSKAEIAIGVEWVHMGSPHLMRSLLTWMTHRRSLLQISTSADRNKGERRTCFIEMEWACLVRRWHQSSDPRMCYLSLLEPELDSQRFLLQRPAEPTDCWWITTSIILERPLHLSVIMSVLQFSCIWWLVSPSISCFKKSSKPYQTQQRMQSSELSLAQYIRARVVYVRSSLPHYLAQA